MLKPRSVEAFVEFMKQHRVFFGLRSFLKLI